MTANASSRGNDARGVAKGLVRKVQRAWGESPFYQAQLKGPAPDRLLHRPIDPYAADKAVGAAIATGKFMAGAEEIDCAGELSDAWRQVEPDSLLFGFLHRFVWLRSLSALGEAGREPAVALASSWFQDHEKWSQESWEPYITGERLVALCCHADLVLAGRDALWRSRVLASMARQTRHISHSGHRARGAYERLMTATALCISALCLPGCEASLEKGMEVLRRELRVQMRADGGHLSRNPSRQLQIVIRLQMILTALQSRHHEIPGFLKHMVGRAVAHLQLFRLGDGKLAVFNGGYEDDGKALAVALGTGALAEEPFGFARHSGFQRLETERVALVVDTGQSRNGGSIAYEGDGSFSLSEGRVRIVVNCGSGMHLPGDWASALRQPGAHSSFASDPAGVYAQLIAGSVVNHRRGEDATGQLLEIDRDMSAVALGAHHLRRFYLAFDGNDLRGQDELVAPSPALLRSWCARFHLHPSVKASLARDRRSVILALPNGEGWRFRSNSRKVSLERTVYCGGGGMPQSSEQIVLSANGLESVDSGDMVLKWGFKRMTVS